MCTTLICKPHVSRSIITARWLAPLVALLILGTLAGTSTADTGAEGTWSATWTSADLSSGSFNMDLTAGGSASATWEEDLGPWGLSGTATLTVDGTYTYNSTIGYLNVSAQGWTNNIQGYDAYCQVNATGTVTGDSATGSYTVSINVYLNGNWVDGDSDTGTWQATRPSSSASIWGACVPGPALAKRTV